LAISSEESTTQKLSEPFIGPRAFTLKEKDIFFGRDGETQKIVSLILSNQEILIYAQSGAGKTSIINAKVLPELETYQMQLLPICRVRGTIEHGTDLARIKNIYIFNTLQYLDSGTEPTLRAADNLTEFLANYPKRITKNREEPRIIIFDQFEELFTTYVKGWPEQREAFFVQLRDAINADRLLKVIFVIREEYLAQIEKYCSILPDRLRTRYHLELLRRDAAVSAIKGPLIRFNRAEVANDIAYKIVDDLLKSKVEDVLGTVVETTGEYVEPVHLQVVCQRLWRRGLSADQKSISKTTLRNLDDALEGFYTEAVQTAANKTQVTERSIREWCEKKLITITGTRSTIHRETDRTGDLPNSTLDVLEQKYLIRRERRAGSTWYELTHDRLLKPIRESNKKWKDDRHKKRLKVIVPAVSAISIIMLIFAVFAPIVYIVNTAPCISIRDLTEDNTNSKRIIEIQNCSDQPQMTQLNATGLPPFIRPHFDPSSFDVGPNESKDSILTLEVVNNTLTSKGNYYFNISGDVLNNVFGHQFKAATTEAESIFTIES
jgi:Novel STAND NTPase 1